MIGKVELCSITYANVAMFVVSLTSKNCRAQELCGKKIFILVYRVKELNN